MASNTYGAIKLTTAEDVGAVLKKKTGSADGYKPKEWADTINLLGLLPVRTASGSIAHFTDGADDVPLKSLTATITPKQEGSGTPSPSNPRPISGTSALNVTRASKNLFDISQFATLYPQYCTFENDVLNVQGNVALYSTGVEVKAPTGAKLSATFTDITSVNARFRLVYTDGSYSDVYPNQLPFSLLKDLASVRLNWSTNGTFKIENAQIEINSTATTYEPYTSSTYTIALGRTVYGGSAEVVGGTGEKTHKLINLIDLTWTLQNGAFYSQPLSDAKAITDAQIFNGVSSHFVSVSYNYLYAKVTDNSIAQSSSKRIYIYSSAITTLEQLETAIADAQLAYELATPTDFTFTGQPINSYLGVNNVWADSGEVLDVEYRADMNLLIAELGG